MRQAIADWWKATWEGLKDPETWLWTCAAALAGLYTYAVVSMLVP